MKFQAKVFEKVCKATGKKYVEVAILKDKHILHIFAGLDAKAALQTAASLGRKMKLGFSSVAEFELI